MNRQRRMLWEDRHRVKAIAVEAEPSVVEMLPLLPLISLNPRCRGWRSRHAVKVCL